MIKEFRKRIGIKLFVLLASLIAIAIVPTSYVVLSTFSYLGNYITEVNRDEIKNQAQSYLALIAREQAHKYDDFFSHVEVAASLMAAEAREIYNNLEYYAGFPDSQIGFVRDGESGMMRSLPGHGVPTVFRGGEKLPAAILREMQALLRLDPVFKGVQQEIPASDAIRIETTTGISRYLGRVQDGSGGSAKDGFLNSEHWQRLNLASDFIATKPDASVSRTMWTRVYHGTGDGKLLITALCPVVDSKGVVRATIGVDISLEDIIRGLLKNDADSYEDRSREMQFSFLLDDSGGIVAFPKEYLGLFGLNVENGERQADGESLGLYLADSIEAVIPPVVPRLLGSAGDGMGVKLGTDIYNLNAHAMHHLNWHLVLVTREAQSIPSVERTEQALSGTLMLLVSKFIANALIVVSIMLVLFFFAVGYFVKPLKRLSEAALMVGRGDLKTRCHLDREDELGILANSFNDMVRQLESAEKIQKNQAMQLELAVMERTRDLRNKNFVLRDVINELNAESERRRQAVEALKKSEEQIRVVMDASLAGHGIIQNKRFTYVNSMASKIFGYSREEMTCGSFGVTELVTHGQYERARKALLESFDKAGKPFVIECCRKDGSIFDALVGGAMTTWNGSSAMVVTVMDISDQKQAEEELRKSKMLLQSSLAEKDVLLREIYHRTKNNMLVIISMLHLQAMDIDDQKVKTLFWETENRIRAMSLVHEKLYQSQNLAEIDMGQYLEEMVTALVGSMVIGDHIKVEMECEHVSVSIDNVVPMGLAINEIVTNSLKHAFPAGRTGRIFIRLCQDEDGMVEVIAGDDGVGLPPDMDLHRVRSFGMQITVNLIEKQLHGTMDIYRDEGTVYRIMFTEPVRAKRV